MPFLTGLSKRRPLEVYVGATLLYVLLFLNPAELSFSYFRIGDLFELDTTIVSGLIRGIGDDDLRRPQATLLYWVVMFAYVLIVWLKAPQISNWLWNDSRVPHKRWSA